MASNELMFISGALMVMFLALGVVIGWMSNDFLYHFMHTRNNLPRHPEMYDDNGVVIDDELLTVKFIDDDSEDCYED